MRVLVNVKERDNGSVRRQPVNGWNATISCANTYHADWKISPRLFMVCPLLEALEKPVDRVS